MEFYSGHESRELAISELFTATFSASEGADEGKVIGDLVVGTAPETISRTIRNLEQDNIVHFHGNMATIPDLDVVFQQLS